jgi:hypothetical protein
MGTAPLLGRLAALDGVQAITWEVASRFQRDRAEPIGA